MAAMNTPDVTKLLTNAKLSKLAAKRHARNADYGPAYTLAMTSANEASMAARILKDYLEKDLPHEIDKLFGCE